MRHIEFKKLIEKIEEPETETREITEHLNECAECGALGIKLENLLTYFAGQDQEQVDHNVTAGLLNIYRPAAVAPAKGSAIRRLMAGLVFDDWQMALNERYSFSDTRHLLYRADPFEIDLRINFEGENCRVAGQVFPDCRIGSIEILSEHATEKTALDENCEFVLPIVRQDIYQLILEIDDVLIEIQDFSLVR